jgi:hypothetical protein
VKRTLRPDPETLVGVVGVAVTDLKPQGRVSVRGFEYDAHTAGIFYAAGTEVVVADVDHLGLMVRVPLDDKALDALASIEKPKRTPRWRWWEKERACENDRLSLGCMALVWAKVALVLLGLLALGGWLLWLLLG